MKTGKRIVTVVIDGRQLPILTARILYRCEECNGELLRTDNHLHCKNKAHTGYIHRDIARNRLTAQQNKQNELSEFYAIEGGKVILKNGH